MRTFTQKPKAAQQTRSSEWTHPARAHSGQSHDAHFILRLQRTTGNHAVQRLLQAKAEERSIDPATPSSPHSAHDFSQIPAHSKSRTNPLPHFERIQARFGKHDVGQVHAEVGGAAAKTANEMDAMAFTSGERIGFKSSPDLRLAAHEAAHVIQQRNGAWPQGVMGRPNDALERHADAVAESVVENRNAENLLNAIPRTNYSRPPSGSAIQLKGSRDTYPWVGEIVGAWSAAMRATPHKSLEHPHRNTEADLPRGSEVMVTGRRGGWLHISVRIDGVEKTGYVSQELVRFVRASTFELDAVEITAKIPSVSESLVILKRAETEKAKAGPAYKPGKEQEGRIGLAISVLQRTGKYAVDPVTYRVGFSRAAGKQVEITTIEDFILFVEQVERQYPSASASEVASEIRQLWFSDVNWEILVSSEGIKTGGEHIDIETAPNPIATGFNMKTLAPKKGGKKLTTPFGTVDIGHVMAGIDAALSSFPSTYPKAHLVSRGHDDSDSKLKYKTLKAATGGDSRDFTTWAGDLGQAYAEYLVDRYVKKDSVTLSRFMKSKAPPAELLGDLHGYIAVQVWKEVPASVSPSGRTLKVSNVLRDLYLVRGKSKKTYRQYVEKVSGKSGSNLRPFIVERAKAFARPWFAKKAHAAKGFWSSEGWSAEAVLDYWMKEFDRVDVLHESSVKAEEKLGTAVDGFIATLEDKVK